MVHTYIDAIVVLDRVTKTSRAWYTRNSEVSSTIDVVGLSIEP